jgi:excisionase family DNA binding protein
MAARAAHVFDDRLPSSDEIDSANQLRQILASHMRDDEPVRFKVPREVEPQGEIVLLPAIAKSLMELLRYVGSGQAVTIVPTDQMLTTQQAADFLNVSRPYLVKLIDQNELPHTMVGRHRRVQAQDLFAYRNRRDAERAVALAELAEMDADLI